MSQGKVFVDASFWITRRDKRDERQTFAEAVAHDLFRRRLSLVSTSFVFAEVHAYFSRSRLVGQVVIRDFFENPILHFENPTIPDRHQALEILKNNRDKSYSFCDAVSFVVMERLGLKRVVTFDRHFEQFGNFELIN